MTIYTGTTTASGVFDGTGALAGDNQNVSIKTVWTLNVTVDLSGYYSGTEDGAVTVVSSLSGYSGTLDIGSGPISGYLGQSNSFYATGPNGEDESGAFTLTSGATTVAVSGTVSAGYDFTGTLNDSGTLTSGGGGGGGGTPDLVVSSISVNTAGTTQYGQFNVSVTVANQGNGTAAASSVGVYASASSVFNASTAQFYGNRNIPALPSGSGANTTSFTVNDLNIANPAAGTYYIFAVANAGRTITELNYANDVSSGAQLVVPALAPPDLVATVTEADASSYGNTGNFTLTGNVANQGAGAATASTVGIYVSNSPTFDTSTAVLAGTESIPALAAGANSSFSASFSIPASFTGGPYFVFAVANSNRAVTK